MSNKIIYRQDAKNCEKTVLLKIGLNKRIFSLCFSWQTWRLGGENCLFSVFGIF